MVLAQPQHTYMPPIFCIFFGGGCLGLSFHPHGTRWHHNQGLRMAPWEWLGGVGGVGGEGRDQGALVPREGEPGAENEYPNSVAVFLCSAFANTS